jgi:transposase InsO family protein
MPFFPIRRMCHALEVTTAGFHRWRHHPQSARRAQDAKLSREIVQIAEQSRMTYGSPRIHAELRQRGRSVSRKRVARLMREAGIQANPPPQRIRTSVSDHDSPVADNVLDRAFTADAPDQKWVTDITYIPTDEGWLYLSAIVDLFSRKVIGWAMDQTMEVSLVITALNQALTNRSPAGDLIHHSDRGSQYASHAYRERLAAAGITISMSRRGNCHDNACAESFWGRLKTELIHRRRFTTRAEAKQAIFEYIEVFYNRIRLHSSIGYRSPEAHEAAYRQQQQLQESAS